MCVCVCVCVSDEESVCDMKRDMKCDMKRDGTGRDVWACECEECVGRVCRA